MSGTLYYSWTDALGMKHFGEPVAVYENGKIYSATDGFLGTTAKGQLIGEYENGRVYKASYMHGRTAWVAVVENGIVYSVSPSFTGGVSKSLSLAECSCGNFFLHSHKFMQGGDNVGKYSGDAEGAAAAAAVALLDTGNGVSPYANSDFGSSSNGYSASMPQQTARRTSSPSSAFEAMGTVGVFVILLLVVMAIALLCWLYKYITILYVAVPFIVFIIYLITAIKSGARGKLSNRIFGAFKFMGIGFLIRFFLTPLEMFLMGIGDNRGTEILDANLSTVLMLVVFAMIGFVDGGFKDD